MKWICSVYRSIQPGNFYSNVARFETSNPENSRSKNNIHKNTGIVKI